jgi:hypothetical protein
MKKTTIPVIIEGKGYWIDSTRILCDDCRFKHVNGYDEDSCHVPDDDGRDRLRLCGPLVEHVCEFYLPQKTEVEG